VDNVTQKTRSPTNFSVLHLHVEPNALPKAAHALRETETQSINRAVEPLPAAFEKI
jgi:hypothetical protein